MYTHTHKCSTDFVTWIYSFIIVMLTTLGFAQQNTTDFNLSPDGILDNVFDNYGNHYQLADLLVENPAPTNEAKSTLVVCNPNSIFNLYFEPGSGMETVTNPTQNAINAQRRAVVCQVFKDISDFITTPTSPIIVNNTKVNIWVRNINNVVPASSSNNILGLASSFYVLPVSTTFGGIVQGGIADNEIWKTIHTGKDSFINVTSPLVPMAPNNNGVGSFYHGLIALNFNNNTTGLPLHNWHLPLNTVAPNGKSDLYTVTLHEVTHALGFASELDQNGESLMGANFKFYSRYDSFLRSITTTPTTTNFPLLTNSATPITSTMYNYRFNTPSLSPTVLRPGCNTPTFVNTSGTNVGVTVCSAALKFVSSTNNIPIYTPICFENGSSFSHFEDLCVSPFDNNALFVMSDAAGTFPNNTKRYLKPQERLVLCDIGYSVNTTYGSSTTALTATQTGVYNYAGATFCGGITVSGTNDGINSLDFTYIYTGNSGQNIPINLSSLLSNDTSPTGNTANLGIEYLQDLTTGVMLFTTGNITSATTVNLNSTVTGIHLLRYAPTYGAQKGNITYVYAFVKSTGFNCAVPNVCNLVLNGDFEQTSSIPVSISQIQLSCGWNATNGASPDFVHANSTTPNISIPCLSSGVQDCNNNLGQAYAGMAIRRQSNIDFTFSESIYTKLASPLVAGVKYQLSFDVSLAEGYSAFIYKLQAYFSVNQLPVLATAGDIAIPIGVNPLEDSVFRNNIDGWDTVTINYTATGGEQYLYLGGLKNITPQTNQPAENTGACSYNDAANLPHNAFYRNSYYYLDNVRLVSTQLDLPATLCIATTLPNLSIFLSATTPPGGTFSGPGVSFNSTTGLYSFVITDTGNAGLPLEVSYVYTNSSGCVITLVDTIVVNKKTNPSFNPIPVICFNATVPVLQTTSNNNIVGTWNPSVISNTVNNNYLFTPTAGQCATTKSVAVKVLPSNAFVVNNDSFITVFPVNQIITGSVLTNDTYNGGSIPTTITGIPYTIVHTGVLPTFASGGIQINANGTYTIAPNTTPGTYTYRYYIQNNCFSTATSVVTIRIDNYFVGSRRNIFQFCYNPSSISSATSYSNSGAGVQSLLDGITIQGAPINPNNVQIVMVSPTSTTLLPIPIQIQPNGTFIIPPNTLPNSMSFVYRIVDNTTGFSSATITCTVEVTPTYQGVDDYVTTAANGNITYNVLSNDVRYNCSTGSGVPLLLSTVNLQQVGTTNPYFSINSIGTIIRNPLVQPPSGTYILSYQLTDITFTVLIQTVDVFITVPSAKMTNDNITNTYFDISKTMVSPNPNDGIFTINFDGIVKEAEIEVYTLVGQKIYNEKVHNTSEKLLNIGGIASGAYLLKINSEGQTLNKRIIIE